MGQHVTLMTAEGDFLYMPPASAAFGAAAERPPHAPPRATSADDRFEQQRCRAAEEERRAALDMQLDMQLRSVTPDSGQLAEAADAALSLAPPPLVAVAATTGEAAAA